MLLAIEGVDGAGKGTLTAALADRARAEGLAVATLAFPRYGETCFSELIGQYLNGRFGRLEEVPVRFAALLYAGDRFESRELLRQLLGSHELVILDRYVGSNIAYNLAKLPEANRTRLAEWIADTEFRVFGLPKPDLTCYLALAPHVAQGLVARKAKRAYTEKAQDLHEAAGGYLEQVAEIYDFLCRTQRDSPWFRCEPLDSGGALRPPADIAEEVWRRLAPHLGRAPQGP